MQVIGSVNTILKKLYKTEYSNSNAQSNITSLVFVGEVVGIILFGYTSDRFSRKWSIFASTVIVVCKLVDNLTIPSLDNLSSSSSLLLPLVLTAPVVVSTACSLLSLRIVSSSVSESVASTQLDPLVAPRAPASSSLVQETGGSSGSPTLPSMWDLWLLLLFLWS